MNKKYLYTKHLFLILFRVFYKKQKNIIFITNKLIIIDCIYKFSLG